MSESLKRSATRVGQIRVELGGLYHYANFTEKTLQAEVSEIARFIEEHGPAPTIDEELWNLTEVFPHLQRSAVLLSLFAFFEHNLNVVCDTLAKENQRTLHVTDLAGRGLERAKIYLTKEIGVAFPTNSSSWRELMHLQELRNIIAHRDGMLKGDDRQLREYIDKSDYVSVDFTERVRLHEGILTYLLDHLEIFFKELDVAICA